MEIKLRAWDKVDKKMYYHVGISINGVQIYLGDTFPEKLVLQIQEKAFLAGRTRKESDGKEWKAVDEFHYFNFGDYKKYLIESGEDFMIK